MYDPADWVRRPTPEAKIWRFMDFAKFVAVCETRSLFFVRVATLADLFEGHSPFAQERHLARILDTSHFSEDWAKHTIQYLKDAPRNVGVSCWTETELDSDLMWRSYAGGPYGVAIQTTFNDLCASFDGYPYRVKIGRLQYVDYETFRLKIPKGMIQKDSMDFDNILFRPVFLKRKQFRNESEIRAAVMLLNSDRTALLYPGADAEDPKLPVGLPVPIDLARVARVVYVSPLSPEWFRRCVELVVQRHDLTVTVKHSELVSSPT